MFHLFRTIPSSGLPLTTTKIYILVHVGASCYASLCLFTRAYTKIVNDPFGSVSALRQARLHFSRFDSMLSKQKGIG